MQMSVIVSEQILVSYASMFQSVSIDVLEHTYLLLHLSKYLGTGTDVESPRLMRMIGPKMEKCKSNFIFTQTKQNISKSIMHEIQINLF